MYDNHTDHKLEAIDTEISDFQDELHELKIPLLTPPEDKDEYEEAMAKYTKEKAKYDQAWKEYTKKLALYDEYTKKITDGTAKINDLHEDIRNTPKLREKRDFNKEYIQQIKRR